jgi:hypothetical protein
LLLRAAGIPARYVTGYAVSGPPNQWIQVTEDQAHAWVEYFFEGVGWIPLDPTPADYSSSFTGDVQQSDPMPRPEEPPQADPDQPLEPEPDTQDLPGPSSQDAHPDGWTPAPQRSHPNGLIWLWIVPLLVLTLWLRHRIGMHYRRERCRKDHPNRRALARWRWLVQLTKATGTTIPEELLCLAEKARFSQHTITEAELTLLTQAVEAEIRIAKTASLSKRLWHRFGLVLY